MRLKIVQVGDAVLRQKARPLSREEILSEDMKRLIGDMRDTMRDAPGVGLAAPQVGLPLQIAVIEDRAEYQQEVTAAQLLERERVPVAFHVLFNPQIVASEEPSLEFVEGCLSFAGFSAVVPRARSVRVEYLDETARPKHVEASGWYARVLQHEFDHLQGTLYVDRMHSRTLMSVENFRRFWKDSTVKEMLHGLR
ncbi:MAG: peptide deformylase [Acidobacteriota bacterium]|nr:peptide deformylase [Acidobacteriota bacterium]